MVYENPRCISILLQPIVLTGGFLVIERGDGLGWALPGGWIEMDESAEQCALRETFEEVGFAAPGCRLVSSAVTTERFLALFCHANQPVRWEHVEQNFKPNREVKQIGVVSTAEKARELCFPTHAEAVLRALGY